METSEFSLPDELSNPNLPSVREVVGRRVPLKNTHTEVMEKISGLNRLALWITTHVGTMGFFILVFAWSALWLGWNIMGPSKYLFDPAPAFVLWLFISNCIQIMLMPLIMVGQNLQNRHSEIRAEHDLEVNIKAEQEIEVVLNHLEYQNSILIAMVEKLGVDAGLFKEKGGPKAAP